MLHRKDDEGLIVISQPAHAWVSGQLARNWGNADFPAPSEEVCLAAEQHDIGFLQWERSPTLNPKTGLPHSFLEMPTRTHLDLWTTGIQQMLRYGRYPALLVSMHFTAIAARIESERHGKNKQLVGAWLDQQEALQRTLTTSLANDFYYGSTATEDKIRRDRELVSLFDWLSLQLCLACREPSLRRSLPSGGSPGMVSVTCDAAVPTHACVRPWPFRTDSLRVICEGRRLLTRFDRREEMHEALRAAAPLTLQFELVPQP